MRLPIDRQSSPLPKRFPVGARYVVEGRGGEDGHLRVFSRYIVLPGGRGSMFRPISSKFGAMSVHAPRGKRGRSQDRPARTAAKKNMQWRRNHPATPELIICAGRSPPAPHPQSPGVEPRPF